MSSLVKDQDAGSNLLNGHVKSISRTITDPTYPTAQHLPARSAFSFDSMEAALEAFSKGEFLVVSDDEDRENEGDLIIAASHCTTEKMAWMIKHTR